MKKKMRNCCVLALIIAMLTSMNIPVFAAEAGLDIVDQVSATEVIDDGAGIEPRITTQDFSIGKPSGIYTRVVNKPDGIDRVVHLEVLNFNAVLYQVDVQVFDSRGLLWSEDNFMKAASSADIQCGATVVAVWVRIKPRAALITGDKAFTVRVTY